MPGRMAWGSNSTAPLPREKSRVRALATACWTENQKLGTATLATNQQRGTAPGPWTTLVHVHTHTRGIHATGGNIMWDTGARDICSSLRWIRAGKPESERPPPTHDQTPCPSMSRKSRVRNDSGMAQVWQNSRRDRAPSSHTTVEIHTCVTGKPSGIGCLVGWRLGGCLVHDEASKSDELSRRLIRLGKEVG